MNAFTPVFFCQDLNIIISVQICQVDRPNAGTLPPYSFFLMTIHYLQQIEPPVLPVIHEKVRKFSN